MKRIDNMIVGIGLALGLVSCANESPFSEQKESSNTGRFLTESLDLTVYSEENLTRSEDSPAAGEFTVVFRNADGEAVKVNDKEENLYKELPGIIELPIGNYTVEAYYGDPDTDGEFDAPYFLGESERFTIDRDHICEISPIACRLQNIRVTVIFGQSLKSAMSDDSRVEIHIGATNATKAVFTKNETRSCYFKYVENSNTLVANFNGIVDGENLTFDRVFSNVEAGKHYKITFERKVADASGPGYLKPGQDENGSGTINIETKVTTIEISTGGDVINGVDEYIDDPDKKDDPNTDNDNPGGDNPGGENPGGNDTPAGSGPTVTAQAPIDLDKVNQVDGSSTVILNFNSTTAGGFTTFYVDIISDYLSKDELLSVGLDTHLDLINPGDLKGALQGLEILGTEDNPLETVKGMSSVVFNISKFMIPLSIFPGEHHFEITFGDSVSTEKCTLKLKI